MSSGLRKPKLFGLKETSDFDSDNDGDDFQSLPNGPLDKFTDNNQPTIPETSPYANDDDDDAQFPPPPEISLGFQMHARRKILATLERHEAHRIAALDQNVENKPLNKSSRMNLLEFRAKYIRSTTPAEEGGSTRITRRAVPLLNARKVYQSTLPSITGSTITGSTITGSTVQQSVPLFSPRSFDRPARTPFIKPPASPPQRLSTPEFKAAVNSKLGAEAPLLWDTIAMTKRHYPKDHGGAELRGQTRNLAYRYMRYIYGSKDYSDESLQKYMAERREEKVQEARKQLKHENVLAEVIRAALDKEEVNDFKFNKSYITEEQMALIMLKAATTEDQRALFDLLMDEVTEEFLYSNVVPQAKSLVTDEIIRRENDKLFHMDHVLSTYTLRQLREELKRYGKEESEFRAKLSLLPDVESAAVRGVLRKQCLIEILLEQREIYGHLEKNEVVKAEIRPWTRIIRTGTATAQEGEEEDYFERRRRRMERKKMGDPNGKADKDAEQQDEDLFDDLTNKTIVDPYVRNQLVEACLLKYETAKAMREVMIANKVDTLTPGLKGEERRVKLANNLVDSISKNDDLFRAWKAVLLQGGDFKIDTSVADDLIQNGAMKPVSRSLSTRGSSSRRRNNSGRLKLRPHSQLWRPDNVAKGGGDYFTRPSTDNLNLDWIKRPRANDSTQQEWFNKVTGEIIPIHNFFSPESEAGGFGVDYLEKLLSRGVSLPMNAQALEGTSLADFGFVPEQGRRAAEGYYLDDDDGGGDDDLEEYMRKQKLRLKQNFDFDKPGSDVAYQRSLLRAQLKYERSKKYQKGPAESGNAFVVNQARRGGDGDDSDSSYDSDASDTEYIARYVVKQIEVGLPQFIFEELLMRFGAGPSQPIKKGGKESPFHKIEFRDENYHSIEDFIFYYSRLEVPVARNKALLLAELLLRVKRRNFDGTDPPDTDDEASDAGNEAEEDEEESNAHVVEEKVPLEPPNPNQKLEWTRHTDDNGYPYFFNWKTCLWNWFCVFTKHEFKE
jgi:hypothetical protein